MPQFNSPTPHHPTDVQIAPGVYLNEDGIELFLEQLEAESAYLDLVSTIEGKLVEGETVDEALWCTYAPIFQHMNWQRRLAANDPYAWAVARACAKCQPRRHKGVASVALNNEEEVI